LYSFLNKSTIEYIEELGTLLKLLAVQSYTTAKSKGIKVTNPRWFPIPPCLTHKQNNIKSFLNCQWVS